MKDSHITLHDVAARAGVSVATASRALTGVGVNKKNQAKVEKAAADLGYVPNEAARSLRNVRTMTVGAVFDDLSMSPGAELLDTLAAGLDGSGYSLFVATAQGRADRYDDLVRHFLERRVDGLLCVNAMGEGSAIPRFLAAGIPVATVFGKSGGYDQLPLIAPSILDAVHACVARLKALGHTHLGIVRPARRRRTIETFRSIAREAGMSIWIYASGEGDLDGPGMLAELLRDSPKTSVVLARQGDAGRILEAADAMSISVPQALSVIGICDRPHETSATRLPISMLHLDSGKVGAAAAETISRALAREDGQPLDLGATVEMATWIERATTGPANAHGLSKAG